MIILRYACVIVLLLSFSQDTSAYSDTAPSSAPRQRISINDGWKFIRYDSTAVPDDLIYDVRPALNGRTDGGPADAMPTEAVRAAASGTVLKPWILPTGNGFVKDRSKQAVRPAGDLGAGFPFVQSAFNDSAWESVRLPHDWAINGPFITGRDAEIGGGMGRLPSPGVAWYRRKIDIPSSATGKNFFLEVDGAMAYAMVWINGHLAGGWPYGYASWQVDLTPYVRPGASNQLAIRLDNPPASMRWYPGGGLYRNVWLTTVDPVHVAPWGTFVSSENVSAASATVRVRTVIENNSGRAATVTVRRQIFVLDEKGNRSDHITANIGLREVTIAAGARAIIERSVKIPSPRLWGPPPTQRPQRYVVITSLDRQGRTIDAVETPFGIRSLVFDADRGVLVNGEVIKLRGVDQHHDLGALGAAFNLRAAERQLQLLQQMGCNAIRMAHNPPAPELLDLTDRMGFLVMDEAFDMWERKKNPLDFHLIFPDWNELDTRAMVRRDRNHPSVILWSIGNEVGEQYTGAEGAAIAKRLRSYVIEEDSTRPVTCAMNWAKPDMPLPAELDVISLNYQGEGIRQSPEFEGTERIRTAPQYDPYHAKFPTKLILSSETASTFSSRGVYLFPVTPANSDIVRDGRGGDPRSHQVSSYDLNAVDFGSSPDKVFASLDRHPFVAGEFVWTGWDHLGEPTPYYTSRSAYCGMIDLAGFPKDRFYLYQSRWRPEFPMAHLLPHWSWPERTDSITPVHVYTSGDEAELFLNGTSLGRKKKREFEYRLRWDDVRYRPGMLNVVAYKEGKVWAVDTVRTAGAAAQLSLSADRTEIAADGNDLSFIAVRVVDRSGVMVPRANDRLSFSITGPGEIVATDNGDPTDLGPFPSHERSAFNGAAMVIVRGVRGSSGPITLTVRSAGLPDSTIIVRSVALSSQ